MAFYSFLLLPNRNTDRARRKRFGVHGQVLHGAIYSFLFLLKETQTGLGLGGMGGQLLHGPFYSFLILRKTDMARRERDGWPTPTWGLLAISTPSKRKTDKVRKERGKGGQLLHGPI